MGIYEELVARGLIAQVTNEAEIRDMIDNGKATFYIGFDPTADSLHVGHFMALLLMKRLQEAGNKPIALVGGGTGMIGDPSGRTDLRSMMTVEQIDHNCECFKKQMSRFIEFGEGKAMMVNNADWLMDLNYVDVLREVAAYYGLPVLDLFRTSGMQSDVPIIREKLLWCLDREIPHGTAVEITTFSERDSGVIDIDATIYCEKASHKGIIIGKQGKKLKGIGKSARIEIEALLGCKVFLELWVKVKENWRDSDFALSNFGYKE